MHDIDRTQLEWEQYEQPEYEQAGYELSYEQEGFYGEVPLHETQELELSSELLEVTNEEELEEFLGNVFRAVGGTIGKFARSGTGQALTGILRNAARQALPTIGGAVGSWVAPGRGGQIGSQLAQQAGALLGLELEGLSPQDQEFEAARQFVRFAGSAYANAAAAPPGVPPSPAAQQAVAAAAQQFAPGIAAQLEVQGEEEGEEEFGGRFRGGYGPARSRRGPYRRRYRPRPRPRPAYAFPVYGGWEPYPAAPVAADDGPEDQWGPEGSAGPAEEYLETEAAGGNGFPAGARNGRWVKRGRVLVVYGA
jgi:hypothetical protein